MPMKRAAMGIGVIAAELECQRILQHPAGLYAVPWWRHCLSLRQLVLDLIQRGLMRTELLTVPFVIRQCPII